MSLRESCGKERVADWALEVADERQMEMTAFAQGVRGDELQRHFFSERRPYALQNQLAERDHGPLASLKSLVHGLIP